MNMYFSQWAYDNAEPDDERDDEPEQDDEPEELTEDELDQAASEAENNWRMSA